MHSSNMWFALAAAAAEASAAKLSFLWSSSPAQSVTWGSRSVHSQFPVFGKWTLPQIPIRTNEPRAPYAYLIPNKFGLCD